MKKESPDKNATSILVIQGFCMYIGKGQTLIQCPTSGRFDVKWKDNRLPDDVKVGKYLTIRGKLVTLDLGRSFLVVGAELLKAKSLNEIKKFIQEKIYDKRKEGTSTNNKSVRREDSGVEQSIYKQRK